MEPSFPVAMMSRDARLLFLGCSTSVGVPVIGCQCQVCHSSDPRDHRTRSSIFLEGDFGKVLVDSGPDLHQQAIREGLSAVDAVLYTHGHVDHVAGFDELRAFCWRRKEPLPLYASPGTITILHGMFPWAFAAEGTASGYVKARPVPFEGPFQIRSLQITPIPVSHGAVETHGFLFEHQQRRIAYLSDVKTIPECSLPHLENLDVLIIDALRPEPHPTHLSLSESLEIIRKCRPRSAYLTHLGHELAWEETNSALPPHVHVAYDGLVLPL